MNSLQQVQDPSAWDLQFPSLLGFDAMLPLGLESLEESSNTQFSDGLSSPYGDQSSGRLADSVSGTGNFPSTSPWLFHKSENHLNHSNTSSIAYDQIEQAAPEWHRVRGCVEGVGVTSCAMDNYEHGSDSSISYNLGRDMGDVYYRPFIPLYASNQIHTNHHRYKTPSPLSTTTSTSRTLCARRYGEWRKYNEPHWRIVYSLVYSFIKFWACQVACTTRLLRSVYGTALDDVNYLQIPNLSAVSSTRMRIK